MPAKSRSKSNAQKTQIVSKTSGQDAKTFNLKSRFQARKQRKFAANQTRKKVTGAFRLMVDAFWTLKTHWKLFGGILLVYLFLLFFLVGLNGSSANIQEAKKNLGEISSGTAGQLGSGLLLFTSIAGSSGTSGSESGSAYQSIVFIVVSLAIIWALRQLNAGQKVSVRDSFYKGMYPLVPSILVALVIGLQLIPFAIGSFLFGVAFGSGVAVGFVEQSAWMVVILVLAGISVYMLCSSIFAFYVSTLPDMKPMEALRSARKIVRYRRWTILRKLLFLPVALLVIGAAITLPFVWIWPVAAQWVFVLFSVLSLAWAHSYIYSLYRELL